MNKEINFTQSDMLFWMKIANAILANVYCFAIQEEN